MPTTTRESTLVPQSSDGKAPPDRRTRRRLERSNSVYLAAISLFVEKGFDETTMDDIAERADVARASVFNYYEHKTALIEEWATRRRQRFMAAIAAEHLEDSTLDKILLKSFDALADLSKDTRAETTVLMRASVEHTNLIYDHPFAQVMAGYVAAAKRRGEVRRGVDPEQAGLLIATGYFSALAIWAIHEPEPFDLRRQLRKLLDLLLPGILVSETSNRSPRRPRV